MCLHLGSLVAFSWLNLIKKFLKIKKIVKITTLTKNGFEIFSFRKNVKIYAWAPKNAQALVFWSYHLRVYSSHWRKYFVVEEQWYVWLYSSVQSTLGGLWRVYMLDVPLITAKICALGPILFFSSFQVTYTILSFTYPKP